MTKLRVSFSEEECTAIQKKADACGLNISAYIRTLVVKDALNKEGDTHHTHHTDTLRAIKALIPTLAQAFGKTQNADDDQIERLSKHLLGYYAEACNKGL